MWFLRYCGLEGSKTDFELTNADCHDVNLRMQLLGIGQHISAMYVVKMSVVEKGMDDTHDLLIVCFAGGKGT